MNPEPYPKEEKRRGFLVMLLCLGLGRWLPTPLVIVVAALLALPAVILTLDALLWVAMERYRLREKRKSGWRINGDHGR